MKLYELLEKVEMQSEIKIVYYDWKKEQRIDITKEKANNKYIKFMYIDDDVIYIEVDNEED